jgi:hypothetical protein
LGPLEGGMGLIMSDYASPGAGKEVMGQMGLSSSPALTHFLPCAHIPWGQGVGWGKTGTPAPGTSPKWKLPGPRRPACPANSHQLPEFGSSSVKSLCLLASLCQTTSHTSTQGPQGCEPTSWDSL